MPYKLILNKHSDEEIEVHETIEKAFDAAAQWVPKGYLARIADEQDIVKYTQALVEGQLCTYLGDATLINASSEKRHVSTEIKAHAGSQSQGDVEYMRRCQSASRSRKPWWRFW